MEGEYKVEESDVAIEDIELIPNSDSDIIILDDDDDMFV